MKKFTDTGRKQANAVAKVYGADCMLVEGNIFNNARRHCKEYDGGTWGFVTNDEGTIGFWYPMDKETYPVTVPTNYYNNDKMQNVSFGAGLTIVIVNHLSWHYHEKGDNAKAQHFATLYEQLRDFVFDLGESNPEFISTREVAGFID